MTTTTDTDTIPYSHTPAGRALLDELWVDAQNWAKLHPTGRRGTRRLHRTYRRLLAIRRKYPRQGAWDRLRLAAAHQELVYRGRVLPPVPEVAP